MEEEEATQPATQLVTDPRRLGYQNSGLDEDDLTDIFCILHPASMSACRAAAAIAEESPQHTVSTSGVPIKIKGDLNTAALPGTFDLAAQGLVSRDIALRLSAQLKDPLGGFIFGRSPQRCDFVIGNHEGAKRISNVHFRIYLNKHGVIMLEDQSTNGTMVEKKILRSKDKENGSHHKHMLTQGSLITLVMTPPDEDIRFVVRIPQRDGIWDEMYDRNLEVYFQRLKDMTRMRDANAAHALPMGVVQGKIVEAPDIFNAADELTPGPDEDSHSSRRPKEWRGGSKYNKTGIIGKGAFATVYMITAKYDGTTYAAKELEKRRFMKNGILDQKVDMEMKIMRSIRHPHIVQYVEHMDWDDYLYLIMDYVPHGDLTSLMTEKGLLSEMSAKSMASQLLDALKYLHEKGITHRDIKPDNILVQSLNPFHVKLTDFGLSKVVDNDDTFMRTFCGTLLYCAPEVYSEYREYGVTGKRNYRGRDRNAMPPQRYTQKVDLWSLAGVLFYSLCGRPPFPAGKDIGYRQLLDNIMTKPLDIRPLQELDTPVSEDGIRFIRSMLHTRPESRPTIEELERSPWLQDGSIEISFDDEDEVDMIGNDENVDPLEKSASQLNINDENKPPLDASTDTVDLHTPLKNVDEIPSSFISGDSSEFDIFFRRVADQPAPHPLFGEVNKSILGSSGVVPFERLNLPVSYSEMERSTSDLNGLGSLQALSERLNMDSTNKPADTIAVPPLNSEHQPSPLPNLITAPSLMGAESLVGMLAMNSPSPATDIPYQEDSQSGCLPTPDFRASMKSLRRQCDPSFEEQQSKRVKSSREIDIEVSKTVFWDARDRSTHHLEYPVMSVSEYKEARELSKMYGEEFKHGESVFDSIVGIYRKSASLEPETPARAHSEPVNAHTKMMKRDDRKLGEMAPDKILTSASYYNPTIPPISEVLPLPPQNQNTTSTNNPDDALSPTQQLAASTANGSDVFAPPRRILAKLIATPDSVIPSINLNITEILTCWGRGGSTTLHYLVDDGRIPKYAIRLAMWEPGLGYGVAHPESKLAELPFYISTKASAGIRVNGVHIPSFEPTNPTGRSVYWGRLCHGDVVDVWAPKDQRDLYVRFRFECYWGKSSVERDEGEQFAVLGAGKVREELDWWYLWEEDAMFKAKQKLEGEGMLEEQGSAAKTQSGNLAEGKGKGVYRGTD